MEYLGFVDTETGGLEPDRHPMLQIALVVTDENLNEVVRYSSYCNWSHLNVYPESQAIDQLHITQGALNVNKINPSSLSTAPSEKNVIQTLKTILSAIPGSVRFAAYNAGFDDKVIQAAAKRSGVPITFAACEPFDPLPIARNKLRHLPKHKLIDVAKHFSLSFDENTLHDALNDVLLTVEVAKRLCQKPIRSLSMQNS